MPIFEGPTPLCVKFVREQSVAQVRARPVPPNVAKLAENWMRKQMVPFLNVHNGAKSGALMVALCALGAVGRYSLPHCQWGVVEDALKWKRREKHCLPHEKRYFRAAYGVAKGGLRLRSRCVPRRRCEVFDMTTVVERAPRSAEGRTRYVSQLFPGLSRTHAMVVFKRSLERLAAMVADGVASDAKVEEIIGILDKWENLPDGRCFGKMPPGGPLA